jgi:RNA polymerase sigma-70 factor (ECF subfamily)
MDAFEAHRPHLHAVATRILGSRAEADDALQEAWLRINRADTSDVNNIGGWLTTVVSRVCLTMLDARKRRREEALEAGRLPDPVITRPDDTAPDPEGEALAADAVGAALLVVLETLQPTERLAFVLHDVFAVPFDDVAEILDRSPDATRQLASRARRRIQGTESAAGVDLVRQRAVVDAFLRAARGGDFDALLQLLDPDVVLVPDAAAVQMGALREMRGAHDVAAALSGGARGARLAIVNGVAGFVWAPGGRLRGVVEFTVDDGRIVAIDVTGDADRIRDFDIVTLDD